MAPDESTLPVSVYTSSDRYEAEQRVLFRQRPIIVAHASEVARSGDILSQDGLGVPLLVMRDREGVLRGFLNVCRHRGSRLVQEERCHDRKALTCPYHAWTYGLDGSLMHIPHAEGFPRTDVDRGLVPVPVEEHGGFIWLQATPRSSMNVRDYLGALATELQGFDLGRHVLYRTQSVRRRYNWKLIIDAFLDGYHIRQLHRNSVYRFFVDNVNESDSFPPHIRSVVARKSLERARSLPRGDWRLRDMLSLTYFLFPNTVLVFHPDWVSRITLFPIGPTETVFTHSMLVPPGGDTDEQRAHWEKTWDLIHGTVFEREDMAAAEWIQSGLDSGANETFALGRYEAPIRLFHDTMEAALTSGADVPAACSPCRAVHSQGMGQTGLHPHKGEAEPPRGGYTWDDFIALQPDDRRELIDGALVETEVPTYPHEHVVAWLIGFLFQWVRPRRAGDLAASGYKVRVSEHRGVMPDLQFFRVGNPGQRAKQGLTEGAPDLVVEVISDSSVRYDRVTKLLWYAGIGCPEYWIVDPEARTLERLVLKDGRYVIAEALSADALFRPESFPGLEIPLAELWTFPGELPEQS